MYLPSWRSSWISNWARLSGTTVNCSSTVVVYFMKPDSVLATMPTNPPLYSSHGRAQWETGLAARVVSILYTARSESPPCRGSAHEQVGRRLRRSRSLTAVRESRRRHALVPALANLTAWLYGPPLNHGIPTDSLRDLGLFVRLDTSTSWWRRLEPVAVVAFARLAAFVSCVPAAVASPPDSVSSANGSATATLGLGTVQYGLMYVAYCASYRHLASHEVRPSLPFSPRSM